MPKGYTDNVVDLLSGSCVVCLQALGRYLQQLACLGNAAEFAKLAMFREESAEECVTICGKRFGPNTCSVRDVAISFVHDRVQEAAYSMIPEKSRAEAHFTIGRLLAPYSSGEAGRGDLRDRQPLQPRRALIASPKRSSLRI